MNITKICFSLWMVFLLTACVPVRTDPGDTLSLRETIRDMAYAYENEEVDRFLRRISPFYEGGYNDFEDDIRLDFLTHSNIRIRYTILDESVRGDRVYLRAEWKKSELETRDADRDGMEDEWELRYGLDPANPADAVLDADADGADNLSEFRGESDPLAASSVPSGTPSTVRFSDVKREWQGASIFIFSTRDGFRLLGFQGDKLFGVLNTTGR